MESKNLTDEQLVLNFQGGDSNAYEVLVRRYRNKIIHFIFGYVRDMTAAEDLTQDTMFKFYVKKDSYREVAKFSTWLYTIAANLAKTELRKLKRRKTDSFTDINKRTERLFDIPAPEEKNDNLRDELIMESIMDLELEFRNIIILRNIQELSYESISKILQLPLGTVKSRLNRGRLKLAEILKNKGVTN